MADEFAGPAAAPAVPWVAGELMLQVRGSPLASVGSGRPWMVAPTDSFGFGETKAPELYRITYDGSITDEPQFVVMGGTTDPVSAKLKDTYRTGLDLPAAIGIAVEGLQAGPAPGGGNGASAARVWSCRVRTASTNRP
jgi:proteasome alpha subunit